MCQGLSYLQTLVIVNNSGLLTGKIDPPQFYSSVSFIWQAFCKSRVLNHLPLTGMKTLSTAAPAPAPAPGFKSLTPHGDENISSQICPLWTKVKF